MGFCSSCFSVASYTRLCFFFYIQRLYCTSLLFTLNPSHCSSWWNYILPSEYFRGGAINHLLHLKVLFTTCFVWLLEMDHQYMCHFHTFFFIFVALLILLCFLFFPQVSVFIYIFYYSLSASGDPFRVFCNVQFSILMFWEEFNLPICYQSF